MVVALVLFLAASVHRRCRSAVATVRMPSGRECLLLVIAGLIWTAYTAGYSAYTGYVPSLMAARGEGLVLTGVVLAIATWGNVPATLLGASLAERFGALRIFFTGTAALVIGMLGAALLDWPIVCAVMVGVIGSAHPGVIMAVGTLSAKPANRAVGMGLFYSIYYAGGAVVPAFCGWSADMVGGPEGHCSLGPLSRRSQCRCTCCIDAWQRTNSCWRGRSGTLPRRGLSLLHICRCQCCETHNR